MARILIYKNGSFHGGARLVDGVISERSDVNLGSSLRRDVVCNLIEEALEDGDEVVRMGDNDYTWEIVGLDANRMKG